MKKLRKKVRSIQFPERIRYKGMNKVIKQKENKKEKYEREIFRQGEMVKSKNK